jgi:hypothetical protein
MLRFQRHICKKWYQKSIINIPINLPRHNHHPKIENSINKFKRKGSFPAIAYKSQSNQSRYRKIETKLTNSTLRQPSQSINIIPPRLIIHHIDLAIIIHIPDNPVQLKRSLNQTRQP